MYYLETVNNIEVVTTQGEDAQLSPPWIQSHGRQQVS